MGDEKYCPLAAACGGALGRVCLGERCAWWDSKSSACVTIALLQGRVDELEEQNLDFAGSLCEYDMQVRELRKENTQLKKSLAQAYLCGCDMESSM